MQVEDHLTGESQKYNEIIKTRAKEHQAKIEEQRSQIKTMQRDNEMLKTDLRQQKKEASEL